MTVIAPPRVQNRAERVRALRTPPAPVNGIEFVEVRSPDQRVLELTFVFPLPGQPGGVPAGQPALGPDQIVITGGVRVTGVRVVSVAAAGRVLTVVTDRAGDFSDYDLSLVTAPGSRQQPAGMDPVLARISVNFKVGCPSDQDCLPVERPEAPPPSIPIDYLAKDWPSFRRAMLDRMAATAPGWTERSAADAMVAVVEALAFEADRLSYLQDAVGTEVTLTTARRRTSLRRHARLLDYLVHEGCNARTWLALDVTAGGDADGALLPQGNMVAALGRDAPPVIAPAAVAERLSGAVVMETMHDVTLTAARSRIVLHDWSGSLPRLPQGATTATLVAAPGLVLAPGDVLIFEEIADPATGIAADRDLAKRAAVRLTGVTAGTDPLDGTAILLVGWGAEDALPFALTLTAEALVSGVPQVVAAALVRGNVVLADHGRSLVGAPGLSPAVPVAGLAFRPGLDRQDLVFAEPFDPARAATLPARSLLRQDPRRALPAISLASPGEVWRPVRSLLGADRFAHDFVVEVEPGEAPALRFGTGVEGAAPRIGQPMTATIRVGGGSGGNLGAGVLTSLVTPLTGITLVTNPLPAEGGTSGEAPKEIRRYAPQAFRTQARAVTVADWVEKAEAFAEVDRAMADLRWTGSWYTVFLTIDRADGQPVRGDPAFSAALLAHLDQFRVAGYDLDLRDPVNLPLDIELMVCLTRGYVAGDLRGRLRDIFGSAHQTGGQRGLFHPDNFTFGDPLYLSQIYAAALALDGVASVAAQVFHPRGRAPAGEIAAGVIRPAPQAILRCDSDPNRPENGLITFDIHEAT